MLASQQEIELPLLRVLAEVGGEGGPSDIDPLPRLKFPFLTNLELCGFRLERSGATAFLQCPAPTLQECSGTRAHVLTRFRTCRPLYLYDEHAKELREWMAPEVD